MENEWYELSAREKISKAKITLMNQQVFFGNLTIHLNPIVVEFIPTAGIDPYGNLYYNEKWINSLSEEELQGVLCHEVLHEVFDDLERCGYRHQRIWNYAADYANNILLLGNNFKLPNGALINSQYKNMIKEEIYDKLMKNVKIINIPLCRGNCGNCKVMGGKQNSQDKGMCRKKAGFDYHLSKDDAKEGMKEIKGKDISGKDWRGILTNAYRQAKNQGSLPGGWDRIFKQLFPPKINWRTILLRFMESYLPKNFSYRRPSRRSASIGVYLPVVTKEFLEVTCGIDLSGSIGEEEYSEFISECVGIAHAFPAIRMRFISHDVPVHSDVVVDGNFNPIDLNLKGGGGTSHVPLFKYIKEKHPNTKLLICFTDGFTTYPTDSRLYDNLQVLWVFTKEHSDQKPSFGTMIYMHPESK